MKFIFMNQTLYKFYLNHPRLKWLRHESLFSYPIEWFLTVKDFFFYKPKALLQYIRTLPRQFGYKDSRLMPLKKLEGKYMGKRCFITCTGPSLTIADLEMLKDEYVFGMNSICLIHDKTDWKPDFYGIQDRGVYEYLKDNVNSTDNGIVFVPQGLAKKYNVPDSFIQYPICGAYHLWECYRLKRYFSRFSRDCYVRVWDGFSITVSLIQIAYYLGFDEIYLLGADCSYLGEKQHFIEHGHYASNSKIAGDRLIKTYIDIKKYADRYGLKIYNATRGGCLEVFQRVNLEDVVKDSKKNKKN